MSRASLAAQPSEDHRLRPIVVCADDFGFNEAVSRAILDLAGRARLSATSAMVLSPHWPAHAQRLQALRGQIDVGLHLDWTSDFARAAGHGQPLGRLMALSALRLLSAAQVRAVIERQLDLFEAHWQAAPDHVDGHQHVQQFPVVREQLLQALARRYPRSPRPWLRVSRPLRPGADVKAWAIGAMGAAILSAQAQRAGFARSTWLTGIDPFDTDRAAYERRLAAWLAQAHAVPESEPVVLMCHPGDALGDADDAIAAARLREYDVLGSEAWPRLLQTQGLRLARGQPALH